MHRKRITLVSGLFMLGLAFMALALVTLLAQGHIRPIRAQDPDLPDADGTEVINYILDESPYDEWGTWTADRWNDFSGYLEGAEPHGSTVRIFVNDVALDATVEEDFEGTLPPGSMVVKENYMGSVEEPGDLAALTVMYKVDGFNPEANDWFWVQAAPDGEVGAAGAVEGCITCHSQEGHADYLLRYNFGDEPAVSFGEPLPEAEGDAIIEYLLTSNEYTDWGSWPTTDTNSEDYSGFLEGAEPHGSTVRIFVNDRALNALSRPDFDGLLPPGSIVVKENYMGSVEEPGDLAALTVMYKVDGFNPEANDWFWVQAAPDGEVGAAGALEGCINCHGQDGNSDYLLRYQLPSLEEGDDSGEE